MGEKRTNERKGRPVHIHIAPARRNVRWWQNLGMRKTRAGRSNDNDRKDQDGHLCSGIISESMYSAKGEKRKVV